MIRLLISAPSPAARAALANRLRTFPQVQVVDAPSLHAHSDQAVSSADLQPDVHLAEVDNDEEAAIALEDRANRIPLILLLSGNPAALPASLADAIRQGAHAVLPNDLTDSQLAAAIEAVAEGLGVFIPDETQNYGIRIDDIWIDETHDAMPPFPAHPPLPRLTEPLTSREIEVLRAMADGLANKEIAVRLRISENTAKFHVGSVMGKLGARSRTEAVMLGVRYGIVLI